MDNAITRDGITADLEAMQREGVVTATILNVSLFQEKDLGIPLNGMRCSGGRLKRQSAWASRSVFTIAMDGVQVGDHGSRRKHQ